MKMRNWLIGLLVLSLFTRLILFLHSPTLWWDSYVYVGMAKYIATFGHAGLWESLRPPLLPLLLVLGKGSLLFGYSLQILLSLGSIFLVYAIARHFFSEKIAFLAALFFSFNGIFFFLVTQIYTEILALFFVLLGLYLYLQQRWYIAGLSIGLAFLAKYPAGIFFIVFFCSLLFAGYTSRLWRSFFQSLFFLFLGGITVLIPYMLTNLFFYGGVFYPLQEAQQVIGAVLGCNVLHAQPWYFYGLSLLYTMPLVIFCLFSIPLFSKKQFSKLSLLFFSVVLPLLYFSSLHCKDHRYTLFFAPFLCIYAAYGFYALFSKKPFVWVATLTAVFLITTAYLFSFMLIIPNQNYFEQQAILAVAEAEVSGTVITTHPFVAYVRDEPIIPIYYARYDARLATQLHEYATSDSKYTFFLDTCGGGMICPAGDHVCKQENEATISLLQEQATIHYFQETERCTYLLATL